MGAVYPPDLERVLMECQKAFEHGNMDYAIKYRVKCKNGTLKWIIDSGKPDSEGNVIINSLYLDVTEMEEGTRRLRCRRASLERRRRFRTAIERIFCSDIWNIILRRMYRLYGIPESDQEKHGIDQILDRYMEKYIENAVMEEDLDAYKEFLLGTGKEELSIRMRPYLGSDQFVWAQMRVTPIRGKDGKVKKTIGKINNIQSEKETLRICAGRCTVKGPADWALHAGSRGPRKVKTTWSRRAAARYVRWMILDMDDFKAMNHSEGHAFADAVLQEVARVLVAETKAEDM